MPLFKIMDMDIPKFIDIDKVIKSKNERLYKWMPGFLLRYIKRIVHERDVNQILYDYRDLKNAEFCEAIIQRFDVKVAIEGIENIPKSGRVTLVANHPLGGLDALAVVTALSGYRDDLKFIVNDVLLNIENMKDLFVGVNKYGKSSKESFENINNLFASEQATFIFPAGMVSRRKNGVVEDLEWKRTFVLKAKEHQNPIVPVFISGHLSDFFYNLSNFREKIGVKANVEMFYLVNEQFKRMGTNINITVGKPILPQDLDATKSNKELAQWIKGKVYELQKKN